MSPCFEKARELGRLILASEPAMRLADAEAALSENPGSATALTDTQEAERNLRAFTEQILSMIRTAVYGADDSGTRRCCRYNNRPNETCGADTRCCRYEDFQNETDGADLPADCKNEGCRTHVR
jgi:hypothetical protein